MLEITAVYDIGDDVLKVEASDDEQSYEAVGWVSAIQNHYDADAYGDDGNRASKAKPRVMNPTEVGDYALKLIFEKNPDLIEQKAQPEPDEAPKPVDFVAPPAVELVDPPAPVEP